MKKLYIPSLLLLLMTLSSCHLIGMIFKAGLIVGIIAVVVVVLIIVWIISLFTK